jgi:hypothetical protein
MDGQCPNLCTIFVTHHAQTIRHGDEAPTMSDHMVYVCQTIYKKELYKKVQKKPESWEEESSSLRTILLLISSQGHRSVHYKLGVPSVVRTCALSHPGAVHNWWLTKLPREYE